MINESIWADNNILGHNLEIEFFAYGVWSRNWYIVITFNLVFSKQKVEINFLKKTLKTSPLENFEPFLSKIQQTKTFWSREFVYP